MMSESHNEPKVVVEGWLTKQGAFFKTWRKRYFQLLDNGRLYYFRSKEDTVGNIQHSRGVIDLKESNEIICLHSHDNTSGIEGELIQILHPNRTYNLIVSADKLAQWMTAIQDQISPPVAVQTQEILDSIFRPAASNPSIFDHKLQEENGNDVLDPISHVGMRRTTALHANLESISFHSRDMQVKTFTNWINYHLHQRNLGINTLSDLCDGVHLVSLLESLSGQETLNLAFHEQPSSNPLKIQNINNALKYIRDSGKELPDISAAALVSGNLKHILDLVWAIIYWYEVESVQFKDKSGAAALLAWIQQRTSGFPNVQVNDLLASMSNGMALCALFASYDPSLEFNLLVPYKARQNCKLAMDFALKRWSIPKLFDPADLCAEDPDDLSIVTYLALCFRLLTKQPN